LIPYLNVLKTASIGNAALTQKALEKFDIAAQKEEKNQRGSK
jgi:hypothetical protein